MYFIQIMVSLLCIQVDDRGKRDDMNVAIIDRSETESRALIRYINNYAQLHEMMISCKRFSDEVEFLQSYKHSFDIIFTETNLPLRRGVAVAEGIRRLDNVVSIVFFTKNPDYALASYSVHASDYLIKGLSYNEFSTHFDSILYRLTTTSDKTYSIKTKTGVVRLRRGDIFYVEVGDHHCYYHVNDYVITTNQTMGQVCEMIGDDPAFAQCNACYLINFDRVLAIKGDFVKVGKEDLKISRPKKKEFIEKYNAYVEGL